MHQRPCITKAEPIDANMTSPADRLAPQGRRTGAAGPARSARRAVRPPAGRHHLRALAACACALPGQADRAIGTLGERRARPHLHGAARRRRRLAPRQLRRNAGPRPPDRHRAAAPRVVPRTADRHSLRQRHRARAPGARRDIYRHPVRADLAAVLARFDGLRQAQAHSRPAHARPRVRFRRRSLFARDRCGGITRA